MRKGRNESARRCGADLRATAALALLVLPVAMTDRADQTGRAAWTDELAAVTIERANKLPELPILAPVDGNPPEYGSLALGAEETDSAGGILAVAWPLVEQHRYVALSVVADLAGRRPAESATARAPPRG